MQTTQVPLVTATPTSPKYVPKHRRTTSTTSDTSTSDTDGFMLPSIGQFKHSPSFSFTRNGGGPYQQHYIGHSTLQRSSRQNTSPSGASISISPNDRSESVTSPVGEFKFSPSFCFAKNGSPPKHFAHGSPPKPIFIQRRRSSAANQSSNWRIGQASVVDDATQPTLVKTSPNSNPYFNPSGSEIYTLACPRSITQLPYGKISSLGKAEQLIAFSYTDDHRQEFNNKSMRYFVEPPARADLNSGYENWKADSEWRGGIGDLLRAVCHAKKEYEVKEASNINKFVMPDLIAWRGNILKIFLAPYAHHRTDSWELNAMMVNGTMYLHPHTSEDRKFDRDIKNLSPELQRQTYHGFAFEKYCQSHKSLNASGNDLPGPQSIGDEVQVNSAEWCTVVRTTLGDMSMIVGAEIDCIKGEYTKQPDCYVELKTVHTPQDEHDLHKFNRKTLRYYLQAASVGIPEIVVGYRSKEGILRAHKTYQTSELPELVQDTREWVPELPLTWGHKVLTLLKDVMQNGSKISQHSSSGTVWRMKFNMESSELTIRELDDQEVEAVVNGRNYVGFLPKWYFDEIQW